MVNILVIGSGAREHAIIRSFSRSKKKKKIYCLASNNNPGISSICDEIKIDNIDDPKTVQNYAKKHEIDFAIIGPENPLAAGIADCLWEINVGVVGPKKDLAQVETSKSFTRNLLVEYKIPGCPKFKTFENMDGVKEFLSLLGDNYVVKYDGLAGGKGVKVAGDHLHSHDEALIYCEELIKKGGHFLIERKLIGEEFSLMSFCDGENLSHMPAVQDHKRAYEGDTGPNTGGMGTYSDSDHKLPFLEDSHIKSAQKINEQTARALKQKFGEDYKGILYGGFIATNAGVQLIEYNARFGDPEAMNVLSILETDFIDICKSIISGNLSNLDINFKNLATVCKYAVPDGYPDNPIKNKPINIDDITDLNHIYFASVDFQNEGLIETGSRTIASLSINDSIYDAEKNAEQYISSVRGPLFHRSDIGTKKVVDKKIIRMKELRC